MKERVEDKFLDQQENSEIAGSNEESVELIDHDYDNSKHRAASEASPSLILETLPTELILSCLSYLSPKELGRLALVCQSFNQLANDNLVWKERLNLDANNLYIQLSHKTEINYKLKYRQENDRKLAEKIRAEEEEANRQERLATHPIFYPGFFHIHDGLDLQQIHGRIRRRESLPDAAIEAVEEERKVFI